MRKDLVFRSPDGRFAPRSGFPGYPNLDCGLKERPLAIDMFSGLGGWAEGLIAEGWRVIGVDIEDMFEACGAAKPEHYELMLRDVLTIHGAELAEAELIVSSSPCTKYSFMAMPFSRGKQRAAAIRADRTGEALLELNALFDAQFRIQREASAAKGAHIPMVVENVRGAEPWVGRAKWAHGSYYLWGDIPALMPEVSDARKVPGFRFDGSGGSFQTASVNAHTEHIKLGGSWFHGYRKGQGPRNHGSNSKARKAASAKIAKIPLSLSRHIARVYYPTARAA